MIIGIIGAILTTLLLLIIYAMCKVSSYDERERERMSRTWDKDK